jgi:hypothetical protein
MYEMDQSSQLDNNIFATLRLGERNKKRSRKDAKTQRKEGSREIMEFVPIKQYPKIPFILSKIFFQNSYSTRPSPSILPLSDFCFASLCCQAQR